MKKMLVFLVPVIMLLSGDLFAFGHFGYRFTGGHWWFGDAVVTGLVVGAVVESLPPHEVVYVNDVPYYYDGTYYYQTCPDGYVVVEPNEGKPVSVQPAAENKKSVTVLIANSNGTSTTIMLIKKGSGYVGPEGEYYEAMPTMKQLKAVYGK
jgi:hypothetical protein